MAEAFMNHYGEGLIIAESAGLEKGVLNPLAIQVMSELGIDISKNSTDSAFDFFIAGKLYTYVVTVCDESAQQKCPIFPGIREAIHWDLEDPSTFEGTLEERLDKTRVVRDQIKERVLGLIQLIKERNAEDEE